MSEFQITERLMVDDEVGFSCDIARASELINLGRSVAVGTFFEALEILRDLGMTDAGIRILFERATAGRPLDEIYNSLGWGSDEEVEQHALPR